MPKLLLGVLCDDVRHEAGGKNSLMGLFDRFTIGDFTKPVPNFHIFAKIGLDDGQVHHATLEICDRQGHFRFEVNGPLQNTQRNEIVDYYVSTLDVAVNSLQLPRPGLYDVNIKVDGRTIETLSFQAVTKELETKH